MTQRQSDTQRTSERVTRAISLSGDKYDSYYDFFITDRSGPVHINIPISADQQAQFITGPGGRAVPVSFDCDYSSGTQSRGSISIKYRHPRNLYRQVSVRVEAVCVPLSSDETEARNDERVGSLQAPGIREPEPPKAVDSRPGAERERDLADQARLADMDAPAPPAIAGPTKAEVKQRLQQEFEELRRSTKPTCTEVLVTGLIAASPSDVEALYAPHLDGGRLEDILARNPYTCQFNFVGIPFGCRGAAFVKQHRARVKDWTPTHFVLEIPLDFHVGRRDAPAWVRRSEAKCRRPG
ncbi:hypothetical protein [Ramlibacter sp. AN1133]|uniref:hypothetical protein n=1 Tax=Ramlibacter sp. AN1133 TaxID=3133429 RepID=UPI0030C15BF5